MVLGRQGPHTNQLPEELTSPGKPIHESHAGTTDTVRKPQKPKETPGIPGVSVGGRYWVRTSDLFGVNEARYHCANRPGAKKTLTDHGRNAKRAQPHHEGANYIHGITAMKLAAIRANTRIQPPSGSKAGYRFGVCRNLL